MFRHRTIVPIYQSEISPPNHVRVAAVTATRIMFTLTSAARCSRMYGIHRKYLWLCILRGTCIHSLRRILFSCEPPVDRLLLLVYRLRPLLESPAFHPMCDWCNPRGWLSCHARESTVQWPYCRVCHWFLTSGTLQGG